MSNFSLRDYFAARAPAKIPGWFRVPSSRPEPSKPSPISAEYADTYLAWEEGLRDLDDGDPPEVHAYVDAMMVWNRALIAWEVEQRAHRFFMWRWYYADQMLATRQETDSTPPSETTH